MQSTAARRGRSVEQWRQAQAVVPEGVHRTRDLPPQEWHMRYAGQTSMVLVRPGLLATGGASEWAALGRAQVVLTDAATAREHGVLLRARLDAAGVTASVLTVPAHDAEWNHDTLRDVIHAVGARLEDVPGAALVGFGDGWTCQVAGIVAQAHEVEWVRVGATADAQIETASLRESAMDHRAFAGAGTVVRPPVVTFVDPLLVTGAQLPMVRYVPLLRGALMARGLTEHLAMVTPRLAVGQWLDRSVQVVAAWALDALIHARWDSNPNGMAAAVGDGIRSELVARGVDPNAAVSIDLAQTLAVAARREAVDAGWWQSVRDMMEAWRVPLTHHLLLSRTITGQGVTLVVPDGTGRVVSLAGVTEEEMWEAAMDLAGANSRHRRRVDS